MNRFGLLVALTLGYLCCFLPGCGGGGGIDIGNAIEAPTLNVNVREYNRTVLLLLPPEATALPLADNKDNPTNHSEPITRSTVPEDGFVPVGVELSLTEVIYLAGPDCQQSLPEHTMALEMTSVVIFPSIGGPVPPLPPLAVAETTLCGLILRLASNDERETLSIKARGRGQFESRDGIFILREPVELLFQFKQPVSMESGQTLHFEILTEPEGWLYKVNTWGLEHRGLLFWSGKGDIEVEQFKTNLNDSIRVQLLDQNLQIQAYAHGHHGNAAKDYIDHVRNLLRMQDASIHGTLLP